MQNFVDPELQSTQETEQKKIEYNTTRTFDAVTDEPKIILMKTKGKISRVGSENEVNKKSLLATVRGEIVKSKDDKKV